MSDLAENMAKEIAERLNGGEFDNGKWYTDGHRSAWINAVKPFADEIESLRQKTQYWPDNAERDAVIRHQKEEIERLREWNAEIALNAREFAEALREIAKYEIEEGCPCNACQHSSIARSVLEGDDA